MLTAGRSATGLRTFAGFTMVDWFIVDDAELPPFGDTALEGL